MLSGFEDYMCMEIHKFVFKNLIKIKIPILEVIKTLIMIILTIKYVN